MLLAAVTSDTDSVQVPEHMSVNSIIDVSNTAHILMIRTRHRNAYQLQEEFITRIQKDKESTQKIIYLSYTG